jgi:hypothetical protein
MSLLRQPGTQSATIATSGTTSTAVPTGRSAIFGVVLPAEFDGTTLEFQVSADGVTYQTLYDSTGDTKVAMTGLLASRSYDLPTALAAWPYMKFVASTQTGATVLTLVTKG